MDHPFVTWLTERCRRIAELEQQGKAAAAANDAPTYRGVMRRKAELLAALDEDGAPQIAALPEGLRHKAAAGLKGFALSAQHALELNSVFYMSALLFRDDHHEGEPNNLEVFRQEMLAALEARKASAADNPA